MTKRKDGTLRYRESYYLGSKKISSPYFTKKTDARTWKTRVLSEKMTIKAQGSFYVRDEKMLFKDYAIKWLETHAKIKCRPKTYSSYESILRIHLYPKFGHLRISQINEDHGLQLIAELMVKHSPKGVENIWIVLRAIILRAKKDRLIAFYPFENVKLPRKDLLEDNFWLKAEINQFLQGNVRDPLYPFYFLALHTGMRLAEICGLQWDRVDFTSNWISVTRTRDKYGVKDTTKSGTKRIIPMTSEVKSLLLNLFKKNKGSTFVFVREDGELVDYGHIYRKFRVAQKRAGMDKVIRFHDLRHTFASNFMMNGGNMFDLQKILGHSDLKMTHRYAHHSPEFLKSSVKFMDMAGEQSIPVLDPNVSESSEVVRMIV